ncbi:histidine triad nucleotide-binding protein [Piscinibacter sakaiensis]|uniref:FIG146285 protein n=1 Tax=Piscinibacter sakaiensis TaxID=1547922 RepID=A0A0K8NYC6_PISS1|nr:histidine triad nucleotide-binding protein [Piscinibacter sakaiensis]GAP35294.1 FIG146285 protein [Piscinibacter sakaiensis]
MNHDPSCIFCRIASGQLPSRKVYEDEQLLAFHDIAPWAPVHFLIIPKKHIASLADTTPAAHEALLGRMLALAPGLAREQGVTNGFRTLINTGEDGLQEVPHLHMHVIGGPRPWKKG